MIKGQGKKRKQMKRRARGKIVHAKIWYLSRRNICVPFKQNLVHIVESVTDVSSQIKYDESTGHLCEMTGSITQSTSE